jgi:hypothetical protein
VTKDWVPVSEISHHLMLAALGALTAADRVEDGSLQAGYEAALQARGAMERLEKAQSLLFQNVRAAKSAS